MSEPRKLFEQMVADEADAAALREINRLVFNFIGVIIGTPDKDALASALKRVQENRLLAKQAIAQVFGVSQTKKGAGL